MSQLNNNSNNNYRCWIYYFVRVAQLLITLLFIFICIISFNMKVPKVDINDVTLTQFTLSPTNNTLYYNLAVNMTFRNPYSYITLHFDKIEADAVYRGQRLSTIYPSGFTLKHKNDISNVSVVFRGERLILLLNGDEKVIYQSEIKGGVFNIGFKLRLTLRSTGLTANILKFGYRIICDLKVPLSSEGKVSSAKFETPMCSHKVADRPY